MKNILVTGGCGFIGSNFIRYVIDDPNYSIINIDSLTYAGNKDNLKGLKEKNKLYRFHQIDITNKKKVREIFGYDIDFVVNFAAETHVDRSIYDPLSFTLSNVYGTQILLEEARLAWANKFNKKRFIQISTDEVYGSLGKAENKFTEKTPLSPNSPYSASKAAADMLARAYYHTFKFPVVVSRCSNNYGPYQSPEKLIPLMIYKAIHNESLPVYGKGLNIRDWLYVEDHCAAIKLLLTKGKIGEIYNIGGNNELTNKQVVRIILKYLDKPRKLIANVKDRLGHDKRYAINASKISNIGWKPKHKFEDGIKETIQWYLDNQDWLNKKAHKRAHQQHYKINYILR